MTQILIRNLIRQLNEIQDGSRWFDQFIKDKINPLTAVDAFVRPLPQLHSVAEHISHMLEWRKECLLRFTGQRTDLMNSAEDWKDNHTLSIIGWEPLKQQFFESTTIFIQLLQDKDDHFLETIFLDTDYNYHYLVEGIIQHDLYHLGQIGLTIKLLNPS